MRRIFVTGDIHSDPITRLSSKNFSVGKTLCENDVVIICGDFGVFFEDTPKGNATTQRTMAWLETKPWTTLFIPGNHEGYDLLEQLPFVEKFGVQMRKAGSNCFMIPNGTMFNLNGKSFWCMGGAMSTDKGWRMEYQLRKHVKIWWDQEIPTKEEMQRGVDLLEESGWYTDYVLTHTMPSESVKSFVLRSRDRADYSAREADPVSRYLSFIKSQGLIYEEWFCGHFHVDEYHDGVNVLYDRIIEL